MDVIVVVNQVTVSLHVGCCKGSLHCKGVSDCGKGSDQGFGHCHITTDVATYDD
jgi:hypothetical protein